MENLNRERQMTADKYTKMLKNASRALNNLNAMKNVKLKEIQKIQKPLKIE